MRTHKIAAIPGDGIGKEVIAAGVAGAGGLRRARRRLPLDFTDFDWGRDYYREHGEDDAGGRARAAAEASTPSSSARSARRTCPTTSRCGACGWRSARASTSTPTCARPASCPASPARCAALRPGELDWVIVRENSEGEYAGVGGRAHAACRSEVATESAIFTRAGVTRIMRFAFAHGRSRGRASCSPSSPSPTRSATAW